MGSDKPDNVLFQAVLARGIGVARFPGDGGAGRVVETGNASKWIDGGAVCGARLWPR